MKVLLSIKPEFVKKIIAGEKKFEYRKRIFKKPITSVVVYATKPVGKIVCEFTVGKILEGLPKNIWKETSECSGISKKYFDEYFKNKETGYALEITNLKIFDKPLDPYELFNNFYAPQSFKYIDDNFMKE